MAYTNPSREKNLAAGQKTGERDYWLEKLAGDLVKSEFPYDFAKNGKSRRERLTHGIRLPGTLCTRLLEITNKSDLRIFVILAAGVTVLLDKYTANKDIVIGIPIYKQDVEAEFLNTVLAVRNRIYDGMKFKELLLNVSQTIYEANENQNYPLETLLYKLGLPHHGEDFPLFDVMVLLENIHDESYIRDFNPNIVFSFLRTGESIEGTLGFNPSLYSAGTVERIADHFTNLLRAGLFDPDSAVSGMDILSGEEKERLMVEFNRLDAGFDEEKRLHELFEEQAVRTPGLIAVVEDSPAVLPGEYDALTYRDLDEASNRLARELRRRGVGPGTIVGILAELSLTTAAAILGVLKAGGAYLPVDTMYPGERIRYILAHSGLTTLISDGSYDLSGDIPDIIDIDDDDLLWEGDGSGLAVEVEPSDAAYVIYTSGSTGRPRGVVVDHRNVTNTLRHRKREYDLNPGCVCLQLFSYSFDGFVTSFFTPVISGAKVVLMDMEQVRDAAAVKRAMVKHDVSHFISVPFLFRMIVDHLDEEACGDLRVVTLAGEKVSADLLDLTRKKCGNIEVAHEYGVTEAAVMSTLLRHQESESRVSIGRPIGGTGIYILNRNGEPAPIGVPGELCITGRGVGRGYLNNPELTAERYNRSYRTYKTYCLYRTGDLARWLDDGNIEFLGRIDHQVKLRGYRIEPGEIEARLSVHEGIRDAVVVMREKKKGEPYLCAYIVPVEGASAGGNDFNSMELRTFLSVSLPDYMLPSVFVTLEKLPVTPNGKIDTGALPESRDQEEYTASRNEIEEKLVEIWSEVLEIDRETISIDSDFFKLGGHSLRASTLIVLVHKALDVKLSLKNVFEEPTVRGLAAYLEGLSKDRYVSIEPVEEKAHYALSSAQERLYILQQIDLDNTAYNLPEFLVLDETAAKARLEEIFRKLIARHPGLRTSFDFRHGRPVQRVHPEVPFTVDYYEIDGCGPDREAEVSRIIKRFIRPFDLSLPPLLRVGGIRIWDGKFVLMLDMHHIISDGVSNKILVRDILALHAGDELPELKLRYTDYSEWQRANRANGGIKDQEAYWAREFAGPVPGLNMPTDFDRPAVQSFEGDHLTFILEERLCEKLRQTANETETTLYMVMLALLQVLLHKYTRQEDIVVGSPITGRRHAELENIIGMFVNMLALRNRPKEDKTFLGFLGEVRETTLDAFENQDYQFEELVRMLGLQGETRRNPLFDVVLAMQNIDMGNGRIDELRTASNLKISEYEYETHISRFDLHFNVTEVGRGIIITIEYATKLYKRPTIERLRDHFIEIVEQVVENREITLKAVKLSHDLVTMKTDQLREDQGDFEF